MLRCLFDMVSKESIKNKNKKYMNKNNTLAMFFESLVAIISSLTISFRSFAKQLPSDDCPTCERVLYLLLRSRSYRLIFSISTSISITQQSPIKYESIEPLDICYRVINYIVIVVVNCHRMENSMSSDNPHASDDTLKCNTMIWDGNLVQYIKV